MIIHVYYILGVICSLNKLFREQITPRMQYIIIYIKLFREETSPQKVKQNLLSLQLDSATSLIQAAKNLMNAVVYAVKASYVASTKHKGRQVNMKTLSTKRSPQSHL